MGTQWWPLSQMKEDGDGLHGTWSPGKSQYQSASKLKWLALWYSQFRLL